MQCIYQIAYTVALFALLFNAEATSCKANAQTYKFRFGEFNVTIIQDSLLVLDENLMLVPQVAVTRAWQYSYPAEAKESISLNSLVLERDSERILVEAGLGPIEVLGTNGALTKRMMDADIAPSSINAVFVTHAHSDHSGGLINADDTPAFPNAMVYIHRDEYNFWTRDPLELGSISPDLQQAFINETVRVFARSILPYGNKIVLVDDGQTFFRGSVEAVHTAGHTPGHMAVRIRSMGKTMFCTGDSVFTRTTTYQNPTWNIFSDTNRSMAVTTRMKMLDSLVADKSLVVGFHQTFPGVGYIIRQGPWFDFSAAPINL